MWLNLKTTKTIEQSFEKKKHTSQHMNQTKLYFAQKYCGNHVIKKLINFHIQNKLHLK